MNLRTIPERLRILTLAAIVVMAVLGPAVGASAFRIHDDVCQEATDAGFTDVPANSAHKENIDCLKYWEITNQSGTYNPDGEVARWQMALFMTRTFSAAGISLPDGSEQGFSDISHLDPQFRTAINQVKELGITTGKTTTRYDPDSTVTRWQMALFLTRLVNVSGVELPPPAATGFTDIGHLDQTARDAISQLKTMQITQGTSTTTFGPDEPVTRDQMASFLIRTFKITWRFNTFAFTTQCVGDLPQVCTAPDSIVVFDLGQTATLRHGFSDNLPFDSAADSDAFYSADTRVEYWVNGVLTPAEERLVVVDGYITRQWTLEITHNTPVTIELEVRWYHGTDGYIATNTLTVGWQ